MSGATRPWSLASYLCERFPPWPWFALAGLLSAPALLAEARAGELGVGPWLRLGLALVLLLALRLGDDLADRERDLAPNLSGGGRRKGTIMAAEPSRAWRALQALTLAGLAGLAVLPQAPWRLAGALGLCALLGGWYRWRPPAGSRFRNALVVLVKYPALVALLWPTGLAPTWALLASYAGALAYELAHDPDARPELHEWGALAWVLLALGSLRGVA